MQTTQGLMMPFLYPCLNAWTEASPRTLRHTLRRTKRRSGYQCGSRSSNRCITTVTPRKEDPDGLPAVEPDEDFSRLDPPPDSYNMTPFTDRCTLQLHAGAGGHGCISFLREKFIAHGPANGGDGGTGGNIWIQAVQGETSLHKLARRGILKAGRGKNGQGKGQGGERGEDVLIQVPLGTIVREIWRHDPIAEAEVKDRRAKAFGADKIYDDETGEEVPAPDQSRHWRRDKWLLYPGAIPSNFTSADFPALPRPRRSNLALSQPAAPIRLDLDKPMEHPMILAAGAMGGLGNPHFVTKSIPRPKFATKGDDALRIEIQLELKLLADVGLVGLPNAGKSTLLRAITNSKARIGNWAFTTLQPNIGTVVLDDHKGRPKLDTSGRRKAPRTNFTIADIPGLIEDAHLDKGLGLGFLRHIERAGILAFVVDLSNGDAVTALQGLWREVGLYENLRDREVNAETERRIQEDNTIVKYAPMGAIEKPATTEPDESGNSSVLFDPTRDRELPPLELEPISSKPWMVIATKADKEDTHENFERLRSYLKDVQGGKVEHPGGRQNAWKKKLYAVPISAIRAEGVQSIPSIVLDLLDE
ncbi:hypothetical protein AAFC00_000391 [Neodothiora populina]